MPTPYYEIIKMIKKNDKHNFRMNVVRYALDKGISESARAFETTRKTVRKWRDRYQTEGIKGLEEKSRAPKRIPHKMKPAAEKKIKELREDHEGWGAWRLKDRYGLKESEAAIHRVIRQAGLVKKKKKKRQVRNDLREIKAQMKAYEKIQWDTKDLSDIPKYYTHMRKIGIPRYQYTARDVRSGALYTSYGESNNSTNMGIFANYVLKHLKKCGVEVEGIEHQSDNGAEFQKTKISPKIGAFETAVVRYGGKYVTIPPRACTWQSDVEISHRLIEDELYSCEDYTNQEAFYGKAYAYQIYFNHHRKNRYKGAMPIEIIKENNISEQVLNLPPILLDEWVPYISRGGYDVPISVR